MQGVAPVGLHYKHFLATPLLPCGPADAPMAKFTGNENEGSPPKPGNHMEMTLHAFSHFMILYTDKTFMLCDLQGSKKLRYDRVANTRLQEPTISPAQCASLTRNRTLRKLIPCILTRLITATTGCRILKIESIGIKGKLPSTIFFNTTFAPAQTTSFAMPYSSRSRNMSYMQAWQDRRGPCRREREPKGLYHEKVRVLIDLKREFCESVRKIISLLNITLTGATR